MDAGWAALRDVLIENYDDLARRLARRLRSPERAQEALHDTWVRIAERQGTLGPVKSPSNYLLTIATNLARDRHRQEKSLATATEIEAVFDLADTQPDPAQAAEAKSELVVVNQALQNMPPRRRAIFMAAWQEDLSAREIAKRFDLSTRKIYMELELARDQLGTALKKNSEK